MDAWLVGPVAVLLLLTALPLSGPGGTAPLVGHDDRTVRGAPGRPRAGSEPSTGTARATASEFRSGASAVPGAARNASTPRPARTVSGSVAPDGLAAHIESAPQTVDVGVTVTLSGSATGGLGTETPFWILSFGTVTDGWSVHWTAPDAARTVAVLFEVHDENGETASATANIDVVAPPFLELGSSGGLGDVGVPFVFDANLTGGAGPFTLHWLLSGGESNGSAIVPSDGTYALAVVPVAPGPVWVLGSVIDSWNRSFDGLTPVGRAMAPPVLAPASVPFAEVGYRTAVSVEVADGTPPFAWSIPPVADVSAESPSEGTLASDGTLALAVTFDQPGTVELPVTVVDGSGLSASANVTVDVAPGLNLTVALGTSAPLAGAGVPVHATISGGLPPYRYALSLSDGESTAGNVSSTGVVPWTAEPVAAGYLTLRGSVTDSTGRAANVTFTLYVAGAGVAPSGPALPTAPSIGAGWLLGGAIAGALLALFGGFVVRRWVRWPWPRRDPPAAGTAGRSVVRELLAGADDGIDRSTLELLAEERHVSTEEVARGIAAWQKAGRVRLEDDGDGREVVRWVASPTPAVGPAATPGPSLPEDG
ncbi:MAG: cadherin-like domain-containing protein [Thermoplasmata archaeon]|nr:cadherin-like domain-containing protein [Thermoplasmata archaeon]